jgi:hypothetical protein
MEICMNKKNGKSFIHVLEKNSEEVLIVTPEGSLKVLENKLFTEPVEIEAMPFRNSMKT